MSSQCISKLINNLDAAVLSRLYTQSHVTCNTDAQSNTSSRSRGNQSAICMIVNIMETLSWLFPTIVSIPIRYDIHTVRFRRCSLFIAVPNWASSSFLNRTQNSTCILTVTPRHVRATCRQLLSPTLKFNKLRPIRMEEDF